MDKFIKIKRANAPPSGFIGDVTVFNTIATAVDNNELICVYGLRGVGKTYMVGLALKNTNWVEVSTMKDIPLLKDSTCHVIIDSEKIDKSILEHRGRLSMGSTIIITNNIHDIDFCECIYVPAPEIDTLISIGRKVYPKMDISRLKKVAAESKNDIRIFLFSLQFGNHRDIFKTSKDYIHDILCSEHDILKDIGKDVTDHGYIWDVVYTNYPMGGTVDADIADNISSADVYDTKIYNNSWDMMDHFWVSGITYPIWKMNRPLERSTLKPGTAWTKFSNYKMKSKKLSKLPPNDTCRTILQMMKILSHQEIITLLKSYNLQPKDIDTINSLSLFAKIPVKVIKKIKTDLSSAQT